MKEIILADNSITTLDDLDYNKYSKYNWHKSGYGYVYRTHYIIKETICLYLHIEIAKNIGLNLDNDIDHKDRNKLNNSRNNLRQATKSQNGANSNLRKDNKLGYKGVGFNNQRNKWFAQIEVNQKCKFLGYYNSIEEAAIAYNLGARKYFGDFAYQNQVIL